MQVVRTNKTIIETEEFKIGDQIKVKLKDFGDVTLTAQKITDDGVLFMFDRVITSSFMNESSTNSVDYESSDLFKWLHTELYEQFPEDIKKHITDISIPTYKQIFGVYDYTKFEFIGDEQFELMKKGKNRIFFDLEDKSCWYWLQDLAYDKLQSTNYFEVVDGYGELNKKIGRASCRERVLDRG